MSNAKDLFVEVSPGSDVFKKGDVGAEMYIIESGQVELVRDENDTVTTLTAGDFFGEAALDGKPHATTARVTATSRLLRIERAAFGDVVKQNPEIAVRVLKQVVGRQNQLLATGARPAAKAEPPKVEALKFEIPKVETPKVEPPKVEAVLAPEPVAPLAQKSLALRPAGSEQPITLDAAHGEFLIGRPDPASGINPEVDLGPFNTDGTLSRRHARILREGSLYFVREETGVANGTFVNGERLEPGQKMPIKPGDKLRFGLIDVDVVSV